jgi:hypothetical protein
MNGDETENELSQWFSTYGVITAERILSKYQIKLAQTDLVAGIKSPYSFYHRLLQVPLRNVLNGIILQQGNDYHIYIQKLFIDYLLSGESAKDEAAQGTITREALENERQMLVNRGDEFHRLQEKHSYLIAASQIVLMQTGKSLNDELEQVITSLKVTLKKTGFPVAKSKIRKAVNHALILCNMTDRQLQNCEALFIEKMNELLKVSLTEELKNEMLTNLSNLLKILLDFDTVIKDFIENAQEVGELANSFRTQFFNTVLRIIELIKLLPDYKIDPIQDAINRASLHFDKTIGDL